MIRYKKHSHGCFHITKVALSNKINCIANFLSLITNIITLNWNFLGGIYKRSTNTVVRARKEYAGKKLIHQISASRL